jgi:hypothetical protein
LTHDRDKLTEDLEDWKFMLQESRQMHWDALGQLEALRAALRNAYNVRGGWGAMYEAWSAAFYEIKAILRPFVEASTPPPYSVVLEDRATQSNQQHRTVEESSQVQAGTSPAPAPQPKDGFDGWIVGNNYRRRGRVIATVGKPNGEPWYEADDGTKWSAYDVRFKPDEGAPAPEEKA